MRLIAALVRHGKYEQPAGVPSGHLPHPLTAEGEEQARTLPTLLGAAAREHRAELSRVVDSSRMLRAWQTARIAATGLARAGEVEFTVEEFDALAERSLGAASNLTMSAIESVIARDPRCEPLRAGWKLDGAFRLPLQGAESLSEAGARAARHIESRAGEALRSGGEATLKVFVGHGGSFRHAAAALGALRAEDVPGLSMWHCRPVLLERRAPFEWTHLGGEWKQRSTSSLD